MFLSMILNQDFATIVETPDSVKVCKRPDPRPFLQFIRSYYLSARQWNDKEKLRVHLSAE